MITYNIDTDFVVYKTQSNEYRAYLRGNPNVQAWGYSKEQAVKNLISEIDSINKDNPK